jgi:hypothetical protein
MNSILENIEKDITEFWTNIFKSILFFLDNKHKSLIISIIHYLIFIAGFYYFFKSKSGDIFRLIFFIFILLAMLSYFIFNKCFFTTIELNLSNEKNIIQEIMNKYFGKQTEGNITSKIVLTIGTIITGFILLFDYNII